MGTVRKMTRLEELALEEEIIREQMAGANFVLARSLADRLNAIVAEREAILLLERPSTLIIVAQVVDVQVVQTVVPIKRHLSGRFYVICAVLVCAVLLAVVYL